MSWLAKHRDSWGYLKRANQSNLFFAIACQNGWVRIRLSDTEPDLNQACIRTYIPRTTCRDTSSSQHPMASILFESGSGSPETDNHLRLIQNVDWSATSLGPIDDWPPEILLLLHLIVLDPHPRLLVLGPDHVGLYNAAYAELVGERHPAALGRRIVDSFPENYELTMSIFENVVSTGRASVEQDFCMPLSKNGRVVEVHMSWTVVPFPPKSRLTGFSVILRDESEKRISGRRLATSQKLTRDLTLATDMSSLWQTTLSSLSERYVQQIHMSSL